MNLLKIPFLRRSRAVCAVIALASASAVGFAVWTQLALGMLPCPWCIAQRATFVLIAVVALTGAVLGRLPGIARLGVAGLSLFGMSAAGWQHFVAARSTSCSAALPDRVFDYLGLSEAVPLLFQSQASCADAAVSLLGIPYEALSFLAFVGLFTLALTGLWKSSAPR